MSCILAQQALADQAFKLYKQGRERRAKGDNVGSLTYLNKCVNLKPKEPYFLLERATARVETNDLKGAEADCNQLLKMDPTFIEAYSCRGYSYLLQRRYMEGIADLDKVLKANRINLTTWDAAMAYVNRAKAIQMLRLAPRAKDTKDLAVYSGIQDAMVTREQLNLKGAIAKMDKIVKAAPPNAIFPRFIRSILYLNDGEFDKAVKELTWVISKDPKTPSLYYFRADGYSRLNRPVEAIADYTKIIAMHPTVVASFYTAETGRCQGSSSTFDETPVCFADIYVLRSALYHTLKRDNEALKDLDSALALEPDDTDALIRRAMIQVSKRNYTAAIADADKCVAIDPKNSDYLQARSTVYEKIGKPDKAIEDLTKIISFNPTESGGYLLRGQLHDRLKNFDKAVIDYSRVIKISGADDEALSLRSEAYLNLGKLDKSLTDCQKAIAQDPQHCGPLYKLRARIHEKMGKPELAKKDLELAGKWVRSGRK